MLKCKYMEVPEVRLQDEIDATSWHRRFDVEVWGGRESFHNSEHIRAVKQAASLLVEAAIKGNDPLGISNELDKWNQDHPEAKVSQEGLLKLVGTAFDFHDLGQIMSGVEKIDNGYVPSFLEKYTSSGHEKRSEDIAIKTGQHPLVIELIEQTKFLEDKDRVNYFATLMRVCDQIGNDAFSKNDRRFEGLIGEMVNENPNAEINLYYFYNFARVRFPQLVPEQEIRNEIYKIWGKAEPEEKREYAK